MTSIGAAAIALGPVVAEALVFLAVGAFGAFKLGWWLLVSTVRRAWLLRASLSVFLVFVTVSAAAAYRYYRSLVDYCEEENAVIGGSALDCLEPYNWFAINAMALVWLVAAGVLGALVVAAYRERRRGEAALPP